ncbi:MAG: hypothetical protein DMG40_18425 [Acidobacteria bacterium]|nr:MAG: hypothetical protein DMG40_18425 [Acidobacteriota bacterium]
MTVKLLAVIAILLTAIGVWAQSPAPVTAPAGQSAAFPGGINRRAMPRPLPSRRAGMQPQLLEHQRLQEMATTLSSMHTLLKEMQDKAASRNAKDPVVKDNLQMWELMLAHLDQQFEQLRIATLAREDLEARRAALYNQADEKAAKEAQAATDGKTSQPPVAPSTVPPSTKP